MVQFLKIAEIILEIVEGKPQKNYLVRSEEAFHRIFGFGRP